MVNSILSQFFGYGKRNSIGVAVFVCVGVCYCVNVSDVIKSHQKNEPKIKDWKINTTKKTNERRDKQNLLSIHFGPLAKRHWFRLCVRVCSFTYI